MSDKILLISERSDDIKWVEQLSSITHLKIERALTAVHLRKILMSDRNCPVILDMENFVLRKQVDDILNKLANPNNVFALSDHRPSDFYFARFNNFKNHLFRKYDPFSMDIYSKIILGSVEKKSSDFSQYFPPGTEIQTILIEDVAHKTIAVEAVQLVLGKRGVISRLTNLVSESVDEFILNALFAHSVRSFGSRIKKNISIKANLPLTERERIEVKFAVTDSLIGVSVRDQVGGLTRTVVEDTLKKFVKYRNLNKTIESSGLSRILYNGLSVLLISEPDVFTEAAVFVESTENFSSFKKSFQFLSMQLNE